MVQKKLADDKKKLALAGQDAERVYRKARSMFFGLCFSDGDITINVIGSVAEVETEGSVLKHCVFTNRYHHKDDSLLLSARIDGTHLETVEISLSKLKIVQARGKENQPSVYHDRIIGLVNQNMAKVRTIYRESLKQG